jgi:hypothetical protein
MTTEERVRVVAEFGFTPRQARFLTFVMRHAGVCVPRQYSTFAGIVHGQKTRAFFQKLVNRRFASMYACRHNRGHLYHVHHFALYNAIGEPNSPHRRPMSTARVVPRLMLLDAVLRTPELNWLVATAEKVAYFAACSGQQVPAERPRGTTQSTRPKAGEPFANKLPIGIDSTGHATFLYLVLPSPQDDFRRFLRGHADLFHRLSSWTLRLIFPRSLAGSYDGLQSVVQEELETPLHPRMIEELKWYFAQLRRGPSARIDATAERFHRAADGFGTSRFYRLYRRWMKQGDAVLDALSSTIKTDPLASGAGRIDCLVLPQRYEHLSPLVTTVGSAVVGAEKRAEEGERQGERPPTASRPPHAFAMHEHGRSAFV